MELQHQSFQWIVRVDFLWDWLVWFPCCPRDSQESSEASEFKSVNSLALSLLYGPTLTSIHDYWKNHSFDFTDLCQQNDYRRVDKKVSKLLSVNLRPKVQKLEESVKDEKICKNAEFSPWYGSPEALVEYLGGTSLTPAG